MTKLFQSLKVSNAELKHRLVMAPLTRYRADDDCVPMEITREYYSQRACIPGTLIISEAVQISPRCVGRENAPGIWSEAQTAAWKDIVDAVHAKGCFIWCQLWVQGRAANPDVHRARGSKFLSSSAVPHSAEAETPQAMSEEEVLEVIDDYRVAAKNAVEKAGFDGVELHGGNGYLPDQFLQDVCNRRTDRWGGSIDNRSRFHIEVIQAIAGEIGASKTAVRLSPWSDFMGMGIKDPVPTFTYLVEKLRTMNLAFLDLIEARIRGNDDADCGVGRDVGFLIRAWAGVSPVLIGGGFNLESAKTAVDETCCDYEVAVVFGRYWTSNPDLAYRIEANIPLVKYDRSTFYTPKKAEGYTDWDFSAELQAHLDTSGCVRC